MEALTSRQRLEAEGLRSLDGGRTSLDGTVTLADATTVAISVDVGRLSV